MNKTEGPNKICPVCGSVIPRELSVCPVCQHVDPYADFPEFYDDEPTIVPDWKDKLHPDPYPDTDERGRKGKWEQDLQHCPDCGKEYREDSDAFCRYCGTKRGPMPGRYFIVSPDYMECVYGPMPVTVDYVCGKCGHRWTGSNWDLQDYCPKCGGKVIGSEGAEDPKNHKKKASFWRRFFE